jgi:hypothetical protein
MATVPPSATPKTSNAILAFFKDIPFHSGIQKTCREQPTGPRAFLGGLKNRAAGAERNLPLRK